MGNCKTFLIKFYRFAECYCRLLSKELGTKFQGNEMKSSCDIKNRKWYEKTTTFSLLVLKTIEMAAQNYVKGTNKNFYGTPLIES
jgi:hypothetical protein